LVVEPIGLGDVASVPAVPRPALVASEEHERIALIKDEERADGRANPQLLHVVMV
jgi:hypothetical protein